MELCGRNPNGGEVCKMETSCQVNLESISSECVIRSDLMDLERLEEREKALDGYEVKPYSLKESFIPENSSGPEITVKLVMRCRAPGRLQENPELKSKIDH